MIADPSSTAVSDRPPFAFSSSATGEMSNGALVRRMLAMSWNYRRGSLKVLVFQGLLLAANVAGLSLTGLGIDFIAHQVDPTRPRAALAARRDAASGVVGHPRGRGAGRRGY